MRINSIDLFKVIASYMIVIFHTTIYGLPDYISATSVVTNADIALKNSGLLLALMLVRPLMQWFITAMFIISGYFMLKDENFVDKKKYFVEKILYLFCSVFAILLIYFIIYLVKNEIGLFWSNLFSDKLALNSLWFLYNLLLMYILAPYINILVKKFNKKILFVTLCIIYLVLYFIEGSITNNLICTILRTLIYITQFTFGYFISEMVKALDDKKYFKDQIVLLICIVLITLVSTFYIVRIRRDYSTPLYYLFGNTKVHSLFATVMALIITPMVFRLKIKHTFKDASLLLMLIYLIHPLVIQGLGLILKYDKLLNFLVNIIINYIVTFMIAKLLILLFKRRFTNV